MPLAGQIIRAVDFVKMGVTLRRVATQTLPDAVATDVSWDTEDEDTHGLWTSGDPTHITVTAAGLYSVSYRVQRAATVNALSWAGVYVSNNPFGDVLRAWFPSGVDQFGGSVTVPMDAGDFFAVVVNADGSAASTMTAQMTCYRVPGSGT